MRHIRRDWFGSLPLARSQHLVDLCRAERPERTTAEPRPCSWTHSLRRRETPLSPDLANGQAHPHRTRVPRVSRCQWSSKPPRRDISRGYGECWRTTKILTGSGELLQSFIVLQGRAGRLRPKSRLLDTRSPPAWRRAHPGEQVAECACVIGWQRHPRPNGGPLDPQSETASDVQAC
jgi:hypothetical protein